MSMSTYNNNNMSGNPNQMPPLPMGGGLPHGAPPSNVPPQIGLPPGGLGSFQNSRRVSVGSGGMGSGVLGTGPGGGVSGVGGVGGVGTSAVGADGRRSSMGSLPIDGPMQDILGRRSSMGFDHEFFGRRDSLDSSTAVIDACILDLTRRRISMAMGVPSQPGGIGGDLGIQSPGSGASGQNIGHSGTPGLANPTQNAVSSLAARQQQIQQQQLELDKRQREIDMQRQQLLAGLQDPSMQPSGMPVGGQSSMGSGGAPGGGVSGGYGSSSGPSRMPSGMPGGSNAPGGGGGGVGQDRQQQWWICQVCNSKAFSSRDEAMQHEAICTEGPRGGQHAQPPLPGPKIDRPSPAPLGQHFSGMAPLGPQDPPHPDTDTPSGSSGEGPFAVLPQPLPLAMASDKDWLTPLHCFVRRNCVQVFCATSQDVATPSKGKRKPIQVGQVGIRCPHCHSTNGPAGQRERGSVYYPTTISSIYNATMNLLQRHLHSCSAVPASIMQRYQTLKADDARSGTSKKYWVESALSLGLVDTPNGIRFSSRRPPPLPRLSRQQHSTGMFAGRRNSNDFLMGGGAGEGKGLDDGLNMDGRFDDLGKADLSQTEEKDMPQAAPLVTPDDKPYATAFSYHLLSQMQPCVFTEADRLGKRKGLPAGFAGLACRHCFGGYGSGRFFPSSIKTLSDTSKTLNVLFNHMMRCRKCPQEVKDTLEKLRVHHDDERAKMKFGSQKAFFAKIWARLHEKEGQSGRLLDGGIKRKLPPAFVPPGEKMLGGPPQKEPTMMGAGPPLPHSMANSLLGLDVLSRQAEADINKRQRIGL